MKNKGIKGINIGGENYKCSLLADDTTLFLDDEKSIVNSISLFKRFQQACGLKMNMDKSEIIILGKVRKNYIPSAKYGIKWPIEPIKALGQWVTNDSDIMTSLNENECLTRIKDAASRLKGLKISLKAKVYLINTKLISPIIFLSSSSYLSGKVLKEIDNVISDFMWDSKPPKLSQQLYVQNMKMVV